MRHRLNSTTVARVVKFLGPVDACGISPSRVAACRPVHRAASPLLPASRPALRRTVAEDKSSGAMLWKGTSTVAIEPDVPRMLQQQSSDTVAHWR